MWIDYTVARLKSGDFGDLDVEHLIEEIESLGKSQKHAVSSYLLRLCEHLFKLKGTSINSKLGVAGAPPPYLVLKNFCLKIK